MSTTKFIPVALDLLNLTGCVITGSWEEFIIIIMNKGQMIILRCSTEFGSFGDQLFLCSTNTRFGEDRELF